MISKTIGIRGTLFSDTPMYANDFKKVCRSHVPSRNLQESNVSCWKIHQIVPGFSHGNPHLYGIFHCHIWLPNDPNGNRSCPWIVQSSGIPHCRLREWIAWPGRQKPSRAAGAAILQPNNAVRIFKLQNLPRWKEFNRGYSLDEWPMWRHLLQMYGISRIDTPN